MDILNGYTENSRIAVGRDRVSLCARVVGAVITKDAASTRGQECVVVEEQRQCVGRNLQSSEQSHGDIVEEVNVHFSDTGAGAGNGLAIDCWHGDCLERFGRNGLEEYVIVRGRRAHEVPEVSALESVNVLCSPDIGATRC